MHLISLNSYAASEPGSLQHSWLLSDLERIDRQRTPWVVVLNHAPWYNSNHGHRGEARAQLIRHEPLASCGWAGGW